MLTYIRVKQHLGIEEVMLINIEIQMLSVQHRHLTTNI